MKLVKTSHIFINGYGYKLLGTLIKPDIDGKIPSVVFYHGMVSQRKSRYVERARVLAQKGIAALCFDLIGCGESDGKFGQFSLSD